MPKLTLKKLVRQLGAIKGRHTELVTVYTPAGTSLNDTISQLRNEGSTADNIKSKPVRKNVTAALDKIIRHLQLYKKTPENGLIIFCGNISEKEGGSQIEIWAVEPPEPLKTKLYWCDQKFVLEPLKEMIEEKEIYGIICLDKSEADIALISGKKIEPLVHFESIVPGKQRAGGQCLAPDTLVMKADGSIVPIEDIDAHIVSADLKNFLMTTSPTIDKWEVKKSEFYKIVTKLPRLEIECSKDHEFFLRTPHGIVQKSAEELQVDDYLLMPEKINIDSSVQRLETWDCYNYSTSGDGQKLIKQNFGKSAGNIKLPENLIAELAQIVGYFVGDGNFEPDRICFSEQRKEVAEYYFSLMRFLFSANGSLRFRNSKNYWQIRIYGRPVVRLFRKLVISKHNIPAVILRSPNNVLAAFLRGLFDAEGYVTKNKIALGCNSKNLVKEMQIALLRFGILSGIYEYDSRRNPYSKKHRWTVQLCDFESAERFCKLIGFTASGKQAKAANIQKSGISYVRRVLPTGTQLYSYISGHGLNTQAFPRVGTGGFFRDEKQMSKIAFRRSIIDYASSEIRNDLEAILAYELLPVKIKTVERIQKPMRMIDISVKNENFVANGIVVHNSSSRFARVREGLLHDWYKKIAEAANKIFAEHPEVLGIMISGSGPIKEFFLREELLHDIVKKKIIGVVDTSYTGEYGLHETLEKANDIMKEASVTKEKKLLQRFFQELQKPNGLAVYGVENVKKALERGAVDVVIITEDIDIEVENHNAIEYFEEQAENYGSRLILVSSDTREGGQFRQLSGIGAMLRY